MSNIPDFRVEVNGRDITPMLRERRPGWRLPENRDRPRLISLGLTDKRGSDADQLDLLIDDSDGGVDVRHLRFKFLSRLHAGDDRDGHRGGGTEHADPGAGDVLGGAHGAIEAVARGAEPLLSVG